MALEKCIDIAAELTERHAPGVRRLGQRHVIEDADEVGISLPVFQRVREPAALFTVGLFEHLYPGAELGGQPVEGLLAKLDFWIFGGRRVIFALTAPRQRGIAWPRLHNLSLANRPRTDVTARSRAVLRRRTKSFDPSLIHYACKTDPDLVVVMNAWQTLPEALKNGILAMVKGATGG
jgi:hypothetical protein